MRTRKYSNDIFVRVDDQTLPAPAAVRQVAAVVANAPGVGVLADVVARLAQ